MATQSRTVVEALDQISRAIEASSNVVNIDYPGIANGPIELVLGFNNEETITLKGHTTPSPYFSSHGVLTDLQGTTLPGSRVETTFPVDPTKVPQSFEWPVKQGQPFNQPPLDETNTTGHGYSKQAYFFNNDSDYLITVGPSLPKILPVKGGGAQFWVGSIGVVSQGAGKYKGARGVSVYIGSAYLATWPTALNDQLELLAKGFRARVGTYFKIVLKRDQP